jgi:predicted ATPase
MAAEQGSVQWKVTGMGMRGSVLAQTGKAADAVQIITEAIGAWRKMGSTIFLPWWTSHLAWAFAELGRVDDAWRCIDDAMATVETTKERWFEAEVNRIAGEIAFKSPDRDSAKAETYFERALTVARQQQAKSWELRAAEHGAALARSGQAG